MCQDTKETSVPKTGQNAEDASVLKIGQKMGSNKEKKRKIKWISGIVVLVLLVVAGVAYANAESVENMWHRTFSSPKNYYRYVEKKNRDTFVDTVKKGYGAVINGLAMKEGAGKSVITVEPGDALKPMFSSIGLNHLEIETDRYAAEKTVTGKTVVKANEKEAFSCNTYMDCKTSAMYMQIPELSATYLDFSESLRQSGMELGTLYELAANSKEYMADSATLEKLLIKYTDIVFDHVEHVKKNTKSVNVEGVTGKYTRLKATVDTEEQFLIVAKIVDALYKDSEIEKLLSGADKHLYDEYCISLDKMKQQVDLLRNKNEEKQEEAGMELSMELYVDKKGRIIGRIAKLAVDGEMISISTLCPTKGNTQALNFTLQIDDVTYVNIIGKGDTTEGKINGTLQIHTDASLNEAEDATVFGENMLQVEIRDLDEKALEKGIYKGQFVFSSKVNDKAELYSVKCDMDMGEDHGKIKLDILSGDVSMLAFTIQSKEGQNPEVSAPTQEDILCDITKEEQVTKYVEGMDILTFVSDLQSQCGVDLSRFLLGTMGATEEMVLY